MGHCHTTKLQQEPSSFVTQWWECTAESDQGWEYGAEKWCTLACRKCSQKRAEPAKNVFGYTHGFGEREL